MPTAYKSLFEPLVAEWPALARDLLAPLRLPKHPLLMARFGLSAIQPASRLAKKLFQNPRTQALFAGLAAHSTLPMEDWISSAFGLFLGASAHAVGWPVPQGGSKSISGALQSVLKSLGGKVITNSRIKSLPETSSTNVTMCDFTPRQLLEIAANRLPRRVPSVDGKNIATAPAFTKWIGL